MITDFWAKNKASDLLAEFPSHGRHDAKILAIEDRLADVDHHRRCLRCWRAHRHVAKGVFVSDNSFVVWKSSSAVSNNDK